MRSRRYSALSPAEALLIARLLGWRLALPLLRRTMRLERLVRLTAAPRPSRRRGERKELLVRAAGRLWRDSEAPCLERSIALHRQLGLVGEAPTLVLGLSADHAGHAWVELEGVALLEREPPRARFGELMRFRADGRLVSAPTDDRPAEGA